VPGRELDGETGDEQRWIARTLASVHVAGEPDAGPSPATFMAEWLTRDLPGVRDHQWLPPAIAAVRGETDPLAVTWSVVHTDPAPEAFVHDDDTGVTGLIDWSGARRGPTLYDVASAVMYLGGTERAEPFLDIYRECGPLGHAELDLLDSFRRLRWALQAAYFAWRSASGDLTGIADAAENQRGLDRARRGLAELGVDTG
jgi:homoserine kinase type II